MESGKLFTEAGKVKVFRVEDGLHLITKTCKVWQPTGLIFSTQRFVAPASPHSR